MRSDLFAAFRWVVLGCASIAATGAWAAGGAHVVDDAEVETPGVCHAENWLTDLQSGRGLLNVSPACTPRSLPFVEIGGAVQHGWGNDSSQTLAGPAFKFALRRVDRGIGLGLGLSAAVDLGSGRIENATALLPVTFDLSSRVRVNLNVAYQWVRTGNPHPFFAGAQIDFRASRTISLMAEAFGRDRGRLGLQAGLRWTPRPRVDIDFLAGRYVDGRSARALTLGLTFRR